jgi:hypothetical protein
MPQIENSTMECTSENLRAFVSAHGLLKKGAHSKNDNACCILEARSLCMGLKKTDNPDKLNMPDIRTLNDAPWSTDELRTEHMLRLDEALRPWATANQNQRVNFVRRVAILTVNQVISALPYLSDEIRLKCRDAKDLDAASDAASYAASAASYAASAASYAASAASYAASAASYAASAASYAASAASYAASAASDAASAASDEVMISTVNLWIEASAELSKPE